MRPLIIHLLAGLELAGITRAVVTLGHDAAQVAECVTAYGFTKLKIDFVYLTIGSAVGAVWRNLASSVIAARAAFSGDAPLLIVRADNLYDARLLRRIAEAPFGKGDRFEAYALVDATAATIKWASTSTNNWARVVLAETDRRRAIRCGVKLGAFDAIVAGEVYATSPQIFATLAELFSRSLSTSLNDAMSEIADRGALGVVEVGEYRAHWFATVTLAGVFQPDRRVADPDSPWAQLHARACDLLYSGEWRPTPNMPAAPLRGELEQRTEPLLQLGNTLGEGANGVVVAAEAGAAGLEEASIKKSSSRLAVKMFRAGVGQVEAVMWEVHVLRCLNGHPNIVQLCDVVELADAVVYVVMSRIEGPDLQDYIRQQPSGVLAERVGRRLTRHMVSGLRHAHARGFIHCDLKPENVRLRVPDDWDPSDSTAVTAVLVDWGLARKVDAQSSQLTMGTALYASPEQLTGYNADNAWGRSRLGPPADVWALGATLFEMLSGRPPFGGASHEELVANVLALNYHLPDVLSVAARQMIDAMLQVIPSDRASLIELADDTWMTADEGPMPPELPSSSFEVDDDDELKAPPTSRARRAAWCALYTALALGALWLGSSVSDGGGFELAD